MEQRSSAENKEICEEEAEPLLLTKNDISGKGGFKTLPFIIVNESLEKIASNGLAPNMTKYLMGEYGFEAVEASNLLYMNSAASSFTPLLGAFVADSYLGRYSTIGFGSILNFLGMFLLWVTAIIPKKGEHCGENNGGNCDFFRRSHVLLLYSSFILMAIGAGGIRASSLSFGADQLKYKRNKNTAIILESFIGWYYVSTVIAALIGMTIIVYIQDNIGWNLGFAVPLILMLISLISFFLASSLYVKVKPNKGLITDLFQVFVASYKKRQVDEQEIETHQYHRETESSNSNLLVVPTQRFKFLNRACIIKDQSRELTSDGKASDPWSLCSVDQVEGLKSIIKIIPMWSTGIVMSAVSTQNTIPFLQLSSMDRHITPNFQVPEGSFNMFLFISIIIWVVLYDRVLVPFVSKIRRKPTRLGAIAKIGCGILLSSMALAASGVLEVIRRRKAIKEGSPDVVDMSAFWIIPYYCLFGISEAMNQIGQSEFYLSHLPENMGSIATNVSGLSMSIGSLVAGAIMAIVDRASKSGGNESWVSGNINKGHYDYYFFLLSGLNLLNFLYFLGCSKLYESSSDKSDQLLIQEY